MTKLYLPFLLLIAYSLLSCNSNETRQILQTSSDINDSASDKVFQIDRTKLTTDQTAWYNYSYYNVRLSHDFIGLDIDSTIINKETFLHKLMGGNLVALKTRMSKGKPLYKLYKLNSNDENYNSTIKQMAEIEMAHFKMEGNELPAYHFTDLNGKAYDNHSTKGKLLVVKCWFIHCTACIAEFPELNKVVEENKDRDDVLFVSLAMDPKQDLITFLKTKELKYAVIPETTRFMVDKMHINMFPTHLLIDRNGKIVKVVNGIEDLIPFLNKEKLTD